jgi:hypothetical protein
MQAPVPVAEYLDALARELRFDPQLSRRVRREAEDHLLEAIAGDTGSCPKQAAELAIARFGDVRLIARQYAPMSLLQQARRVGGMLIVAIAAILVVMKGRIALYDVLQWRLNPDWLGGLGAIGPVINRHAFQVLLVLGIVSWLYIVSRRAASAIDNACRQQLQRALLLSAVTTALLIGTVVLDTILGGLRALDAGISLAAIIPLSSIAVEIGLIAVLAMELRRMMARKALVASMFADESAHR